MNPWTFLGAALAGGCGAALRLYADGVVRGRWGSRLPWGTWFINLSGSFALGLLVGAAQVHLWPSAVATIVGTGFLGGYTTFSTASVESVRLLEQRRVRSGMVNALGMLVGAVIAAALGRGVGLLSA